MSKRPEDHLQSGFPRSSRSLRETAIFFEKMDKHGLNWCLAPKGGVRTDFPDGLYLYGEHNCKFLQVICAGPYPGLKTIMECLSGYILHKIGFLPVRPKEPSIQVPFEMLDRFVVIELRRAPEATQTELAA